MYKTLILIIISILCSINTYAQKSYNEIYKDSIIIISYNVENLFYPTNDTINNDYDFTPNGKYHWTFNKYKQKINNISRVLTNINKWSYPDIVGIYEIENELCLKDLCKNLSNAAYKYIHYESSDKRGIDVAILYDTTNIEVIKSYPINNSYNFKTRDILYAQIKINKNTKDTFHIFACHLPSQLSGKSSTDLKRNVIKNTIKQNVDSITYICPNANIIVMGDMNDAPQDDLLPLHNQMLILANNNIGTYKYKGIWSILDQFYVSDNLTEHTKTYIYSPNWLQEKDSKFLGIKPKRTFNGYHYNKNGYSDHLPIILYIYL